MSCLISKKCFILKSSCGNLQEIRKQLGISLIDEEKMQLAKVVGENKVYVWYSILLEIQSTNMKLCDVWQERRRCEKCGNDEAWFESRQVHFTNINKIRIVGYLGFISVFSSIRKSNKFECGLNKNADEIG